MVAPKPAILLWLSALLLVAAGAAHATHLAEAIESVERGGKKAAACVPCHGPAGISRFPTVPHLAGQKPHYLEAEIKAFAGQPSGHVGDSPIRRREERAMSQLTVSMAMADASDLAAFFAALPCARPQVTADGAVPDAIQRCVGCHGVDGMSEKAKIPHLAAQQQQYLANQMRSFRDSLLDVATPGVPRERYHVLMGREALHLSDEDIAALSRYYAAQPCR